MFRPNKPIALTPRLLASAPELGVLRVADLALQQLALLLYAEHETLGIGDFPDEPRNGEPPTLRAARSLLTGISTATGRIRRYEEAVLHVLQPRAAPQDADDSIF